MSLENAIKKIIEKKLSETYLENNEELMNLQELMIELDVDFDMKKLSEEILKEVKKYYSFAKYDFRHDVTDISCKECGNLNGLWVCNDGSLINQNDFKGFVLWKT
jgi:hypothetical protein